MFHIASIFSKENIIPILGKYFKEEELKILLNQQDTLKQKNTPVHLAIKHKNVKILKENLNLKKFIQWNKTNQNGKTPLSLSQEMNEIEIINLLRKNGIKK